jgi:hypothetical protein
VDRYDIFVSYSHQDRERVRVLVQALADEGWQVFWDRTIPPGETWRSFIGAPLAAAPVVIVCWSAHSIASDWVEQEADAAAKRKVLVPVLIDHVEPPLGLRHVHLADLVDWTAAGGGKLPEALRIGVRRKLQSGTPTDLAVAPVLPPARPAPAVASSRPGWLPWLAVAALVAVLGGVLAAWQLWPADISRPQAAAPGYAIGSWLYRATPDTYAPDQNLAEKVRALHGPQAEIVDWMDLKKALADRAALQGFIASLGIAVQASDERDNYLLVNGGQSHLQGMHYLLARHGGNRPPGWAILDTIGEDELHLGRWSHTGRILVRTPHAR